MGLENVKVMIGASSRPSAKFVVRMETPEYASRR